MAANYDIGRLQQIASRYQGFGENQVNPGNFTAAPSGPTQQPNYLGSIFSSIRGAAGAGAGAVGGFLHKSLVEEPTAWAKYAGGNLNTFAHTPLNALHNYQQFQKDHNYEAYRQAQKNLIGTTTNAFRGSFGGVPTKELVQKGLPVGLTAASLVLPFAKGGSAIKAAEGANVADLSLGQKAVNGATNFGSSIVTGNGNFAARFSNPILQNAAKGVSGLTYNALVTRPTIESLQQAPQDISNIAHGKDIGSSAFNLAGLGAPAIVTGLQKGAKVAGNVVGKAIFDKPGSVLHQLQFKGGETLKSFLDNAPASLQKKYMGIAKVAEDHIQSEKRTAQDLINYQASHGNEIASMSAKEFLDQQAALAKSSNRAQSTIKALVARAEGGDEEAKAKLLQTFNHIPTASEIGRIGVGKFDQTEAASLVKRVEALGGDGTKIQKFIEDAKAAREPWTLNPNVSQKVQLALTRGDIKDVTKEINSITRTRSLGKDMNLKLDNGYFPIMKPSEAGGFVKPSQAADLVEGRQAKFGAFGRGIEKVGLSPRAVDSRQVTSVLTDKLDQRLAGTNYEGKAKEILRALRQRAGNTATAVDPRQLSVKTIGEVLGKGTTRSEAKQVKMAVMKAYGDIPASLVGAGVKLVNKVSAIRGVGSAEQYYLRAKGAASYQYNPFFQGKVLTKSAAINMAEGGNPFARASKETTDALSKAGYFDKWKSDAGLADLLGNIDGMNGKQINRAQQHLVSSLAESLAGANHTTVDKILADKASPLYKEFDHALATVTGYGKGGYLNSPLAKTLNVAIFPSRFDTKVLTVAAKTFARQNPATQIAIVKQLANGKQWLDSSAGQQWKKDNAALLNTLDYFTPLHTIESVANAIGSKKLVDLGQIGGMPFGFIQQILKSSGVPMPDILKQSQHTDLATGETYADKVGNTSKAKLQLGLEELLGSMFSYPGATIGLPSKTKVMEGALPFLKPEKGSIDYQGGSKLESKSMQPDTPSTLKSVPKFNAPEVVKGLKFYKPPKAKKVKTKTPSKPISSLL